MPSNPTLPDDVREKALRAVIGAVYPGWSPDPRPEPYSDLRVNAEAERQAAAIIDAIAPLIIEWARKDTLLKIRIAQLEAREKRFAVSFNGRGGVASESFMRAWAATETALRDARAQFPTPDETGGFCLVCGMHCTNPEHDIPDETTGGE